AFLTRLFDTSEFQARRHAHGWTPELGWLHNTADVLIWLAYLAIPALLIYFVRRRRQVSFPFLFWMFGGFITCCGFTHLMEVVTFYTPLYWLSGIVKVLTAGVSWATVLALAPVVPKALSLRSPRELEREIAERKRAKKELAEASEFTRQIIANAREGIIVYDRKLRYQLWNPFMEELSGLPAAEVVGQHPLELFPFLREQGMDVLLER